MYNNHVLTLVHYSNNDAEKLGVFINLKPAVIQFDLLNQCLGENQKLPVTKTEKQENEGVAITVSENSFFVAFLVEYKQNEDLAKHAIVLAKISINRTNNDQTLMKTTKIGCFSPTIQKIQRIQFRPDTSEISIFAHRKSQTLESGKHHDIKNIVDIYCIEFSRFVPKYRIKLAKTEYIYDFAWIDSTEYFVMTHENSSFSRNNTPNEIRETNEIDRNEHKRQTFDNSNKGLSLMLDANVGMVGNSDFLKLGRLDVDNDMDPAKIINRQQCAMAVSSEGAIAMTFEPKPKRVSKNHQISPPTRYLKIIDPVIDEIHDIFSEEVSTRDCQLFYKFPNSQNSQQSSIGEIKKLQQRNSQVAIQQGKIMAGSIWELLWIVFGEQITFIKEKAAKYSQNLKNQQINRNNRSLAGLVHPNARKSLRGQQMGQNSRKSMGFRFGNDNLGQRTKMGAVKEGFLGTENQEPEPVYNLVNDPEINQCEVDSLASGDNGFRSRNLPFAEHLVQKGFDFSSCGFDGKAGVPRTPNTPRTNSNTPRTLAPSKSENQMNNAENLMKKLKFDCIGLEKQLSEMLFELVENCGDVQTFCCVFLFLKESLTNSELSSDEQFECCFSKLSELFEIQDRKYQIEDIFMSYVDQLKRLCLWHYAACFRSLLFWIKERSQVQIQRENSKTSKNPKNQSKLDHDHIIIKDIEVEFKKTVTIKNQGNSNLMNTGILNDNVGSNDRSHGSGEKQEKLSEISLKCRICELGINGLMFICTHCGQGNHLVCVSKLDGCPNDCPV